VFPSSLDRFPHGEAWESGWSQGERAGDSGIVDYATGGARRT